MWLALAGISARKNALNVLLSRLYVTINNTHSVFRNKTLL